MIKERTAMKELTELDKKHFFHPTSAIKQQQENGPAFIFTEGKGVYLYDQTGAKVLDGMSSLWNVNIGHELEGGYYGIEEYVEVKYISMHV